MTTERQGSEGKTRRSPPPRAASGDAPPAGARAEQRGWNEEEQWSGPRASIRGIYYRLVLVDAPEERPTAPGEEPDLPPLELSVWPDEDEEGFWEARLDVNLAQEGTWYTLGKSRSAEGAKRIALRRGAEILLRAAENLEAAS